MMLCIDTTLAVSGTYTKQNERYIVSILPSFKIFQTLILGQSKKRFLYIQPFLRLDFAKIKLFVQCNALILSIISSYIRN